MRRAVWYGFSTWIPAAGSSQRTRRRRRTRRGEQREQLAPAHARRRRGRRRARPRRRAPCRGRAAGRRAGSARRPGRCAEKIVCQRVTGPTRSTRNPAIASTNRTLPSSEGWNWMTPRSIQRFEPRIVSASDEDDDHQRERRAVDELPVTACEIERDARPRRRARRRRAPPRSPAGRRSSSRRRARRSA